MKPNRKLLVTDMDGTLVDSHRVMHQETIEALDWLRKQGHVVCYATGRRKYDMERVAYQYDCVDYVVLNTGSIIEDARTHEYLFDEYVLPEASAQLIDACVERGWQLYVIFNDGYGLNIITPGSEDYAEATGCAPIVYRSSADLDLGKVQGFMVSRDRMEIVSYIEETGLPLTCICSEPECYDITPKGCSKWETVSRLAAMLEIPQKNIIAMGNWLNDMEMVVNAGCGVAVADACEELRAAADFVTTRGHSEDAILDVCQHCFD